MLMMETQNAPEEILQNKDVEIMNLAFDGYIFVRKLAEGKIESPEFEMFMERMLRIFESGFTQPITENSDES